MFKNWNNNSNYVFFTNKLGVLWEDKCLEIDIFSSKWFIFNTIFSKFS